MYIFSFYKIILFAMFNSQLLDWNNRYTLLMTNCFWQHVKSSNDSADRASRGVMPIVPTRLLILYWCGAHGNLSEWDDLSPLLLSLCDLPKCLSSYSTRIVDMTNRLFTRICSCDGMLRTVTRIILCCLTATCCRRNYDPSVLVAVCGVWVPYLCTAK